MSSVNDKKQLLIKLVRDKAKFLDALAIDTSLKAARNPNKPEALADAFRIVSAADHCNNLAEEIIKLIEELWPVEKLGGD